MAKIVTVCNRWRRDFELTEMSYIRWLKISQALARLGHQVDIATNEFVRWRRKKYPIRMGQTLRRVPLAEIKWSDYDVVKTLFHTGFDTLEAYAGLDHPFIISKLGSVVGPHDMDGIYFYGRERKKLYATQEKIHRTSRYITVLSKPAEELWTTCFGSGKKILIVPGGVDRYIPPPARDPYPKDDKIRCIFAGNVYARNTQPEANRVLVAKLNRLGRLLSDRGAKLYVLGPGQVRQIDKRCVTYVGIVPYQQAWNYFHFAHVGVVVAAGRFMHNNESTKIYHYLRIGLPVVSEAGFPNDNVITETRLGYLVENDNLEQMAQKIEEAPHVNWDRNYAINYVLENHTWDKRAEVYSKIIREDLL